MMSGNVILLCVTVIPKYIQIYLKEKLLTKIVFSVHGKCFLSKVNLPQIVNVNFLLCNRLTIYHSTLPFTSANQKSSI